MVTYVSQSIVFPLSIKFEFTNKYPTHNSHTVSISWNIHHVFSTTQHPTPPPPLSPHSFYSNGNNKQTVPLDILVFHQFFNISSLKYHWTLMFSSIVHNLVSPVITNIRFLLTLSIVNKFKMEGRPLAINTGFKLFL